MTSRAGADDDQLGVHSAGLLEGGGGGEGRGGRGREEGGAVVRWSVERCSCDEGNGDTGAERCACAAEGVGEQRGECSDVVLSVVVVEIES